MAKKNDMTYGSDVRLLTIGNSADYKDYILQNMNMTSYAVLFCADTWSETIEMQTYNRDLLYNQSMTEEERKKASTKSFDFFLSCQF